MTKNIIWLKNEINKRINNYSKFGIPYTQGIVDGLTQALSLIEELDSVDNDVKVRKRMDTMQHQIDVLQKEVLDLSKCGGLNEIKQKEKDYLNG